jgi:hypothetical protein
MYRDSDELREEYLLWQGKPENCNRRRIAINLATALMYLIEAFLLLLYFQIYPPPLQMAWLFGLAGLLITYPVGLLLTMDFIESLIVYLNVDILEREIYLPKKIPLPPPLKKKEKKDYPPDHGLSNKLFSQPSNWKKMIKGPKTLFDTFRFIRPAKTNKWVLPLYSKRLPKEIYGIGKWDQIEKEIESEKEAKRRAAGYYEVPGNII